jgi:hypothetical protein
LPAIFYRHGSRWLPEAAGKEAGGIVPDPKYGGRYFANIADQVTVRGTLFYRFESGKYYG